MDNSPTGFILTALTDKLVPDGRLFHSSYPEPHNGNCIALMMMSRFLQRVINSPQTRYRSADQVGLEVSSEHRGGEGCGSQSGW